MSAATTRFIEDLVLVIEYWPQLLKGGPVLALLAVHLPWPELQDYSMRSMHRNPSTCGKYSG